MNTYGTLDYSNYRGTWELIDREGERLTIKEGDVISLGFLQGREVCATLLRNMTGQLEWAISPVDATPRPGGHVTIRQTA